MAADALGFMQALHLQQVDLLGYSLGGIVAQKLASDNPVLVRKLILANTVQPGGGNNLMKVLGETMWQKGYPDPRMVLNMPATLVLHGLSTSQA
jgi:pimeloyl-ACP methyl ester carboxylesterase